MEDIRTRGLVRVLGFRVSRFRVYGFMMKGLGLYGVFLGRVPGFFFPRVGSAWALELGLAPWSRGPVVFWSRRPCSEPLVLWPPNPLVPWSCGPLVLWSPVLRSPGPLVSWSAGLWLRLLEGYESCEKLARSSMCSFWKGGTNANDNICGFRNATKIVNDSILTL